MKITETKLREKFEDLDKAVFGIHKYAESIALHYHEESKINRFSSRQLGERILAFDNDYIASRASQAYKIYPQAQKVFLNSQDYSLPKDEFLETVKKRRSVRNFDKEYRLSLSDLHILCQYAYGISAEVKMGNTTTQGAWAYRTVSSPGALYSLEMYLVVFNSEISDGLYHFRPDIQALELVKEGEFYDSINAIIVAEPIITLSNANCVIFTTGIFERLFIKYGERGYRFMLLEAGALGHNISLICETLGLGSCWVGSYYDREVNEFLEVDGVGETIQNVIVIGKKLN